MVAKEAAVAAGTGPGLGIAVALVGGLLLFQAAKDWIPNAIGDGFEAATELAAAAASKTAEGSGDFLKGFFGIDEPSLNALEFADAQDDPSVYILTGPDGLAFNDRVTIPVDQLPGSFVDRVGGILNLEAFPEDRIVVRNDILLNDASIAGDLGATLGEPIRNIFTEPFIDFGFYETPSITDAFSGTKDFFGGIF